MAEKEVVIVSAARTPIGKFLGGLMPLRAPELGAIAVREAISRAGIGADVIEEVILGNVVQAGVGQSPARQAAIIGGVPESVGATTINKVCGSGLRAVSLAAQIIKAGDADCILAGGFESMSNAPHLLMNSRTGVKLGNFETVDSVVKDGLWDSFEDFHMGNTAELVAEKYDIKREAQDEYAYNSHQKAVAAISAGHFKDEIVPVEIKGRKGTTVIDTDESPRSDTSIEVLGKLRPAFKKDGTVTAGNAPSLNDGAAALVVMSGEKARALGLKPLARIVGYTTGHLEPKWVMMAPVEAVKQLRQKTGLTNEKVDLFELNEAFSVQAMACSSELDIDPSRVNICGGAVALGHPIGASGARILTTLLYTLQREKKQTGIASLCLGGGGAVALAVEMMN